MPTNAFGEYTKHLTDTYDDKIEVEGDPGGYVYVTFRQEGGGTAEMSFDAEALAKFRKALKRASKVIA